MFGQLFNMFGHGFALMLEIVVYRAAQAGMSDIVRVPPG